MQFGGSEDHFETPPFHIVFKETPKFATPFLGAALLGQNPKGCGLLSP